MNDNFMYSLRQHPDKNFSAQLKNRLDERTLKQAPKPAIRRAGLAFGFSMVLVIAAISMVLAVPSVRAKLQDLVINIGGQGFLVSNEHPLTYQATTVQPVAIPIEQAAENGVILPTYIPEGFSLEQDQYLFYHVEDSPEGKGDWAEVTWVGPDYEKIAMIVSDSENIKVVGTESLEEISLKGIYPAGLYKGGWDNDSFAWNPTIPFYSLVFVKDGKSISFIGPDPQKLILMAESLYP